MSNDTNNIPQEIIQQWREEAKEKFPMPTLFAEERSWTTHVRRNYWVQGRKDQYLSSIPQPPQDKLEVLEKILLLFSDYYVSNKGKSVPYGDQFIDAGKLHPIKWFIDGWKNESREAKPLISSLFSPAAQPTGLDLKKIQERFDKMFETETPESFEKWLNEKDRERPGLQDDQKSNCNDKDTGFSQPTNEPIELTEDIKQWIEGNLPFNLDSAPLNVSAHDWVAGEQSGFRIGANAMYSHLRYIIEKMEAELLKEPAPTAEDWEKEFDEFFRSQEDAFYSKTTVSIQRIINWVKSNVPKVVVGGNWVNGMPSKQGQYCAEYPNGERIIKWFFPNSAQSVHEWAIFRRYLSLDESTSLSDIIEQVRKENPHLGGNGDAVYGWNGALDKLINKIKIS